MLEVLQQAQVIENDYVKRWKQNGGRVIGYGCAFTPPEIFEAVGVLPYRLRALGNSRTERADARLSRFNCSFCRSCLELGLEGVYDFLDGLVETNGCDQLRGMFENWQYARPQGFFQYLKGPHVTTTDAMDYYVRQLRAMAEATAQYFHQDFREDALREAICRHAKIRKLLRQLNTLRERERPALTGAEMLALTLLGTAMPSADYLGLLEETLTAVSSRELTGYRARLVLGGSATDEIEFVRLMEDLGGLVVADMLCFGVRAFWPEWNGPDTDPWRILAEQYLGQSLCPRMFDAFSRRLAFLLDTVDRFRADGIVLVHNKFCDLHGIDNTLLRLRLRERNLPVLTLEKEYGGLADLGRLRTRIQAFLEQLGGQR